MNLKKLSQSGTGKLVKVPQGYWAFVPNPLPPKIEFSSQLVNALSEGDRMLGALEGMGRTLPNPTLLVMPYARREAVSSGYPRNSSGATIFPAIADAATT